MKIAILKERYTNETRVAITPDVVKLFTRDGFNVWVESNAGLSAGFDNQQYINAGGKISNVPLEIVSDADIILKVQPTPEAEQINELNFAKKGALLIGLLNPSNNKALISHYAKKGINALSLELMPRISKVQHMDALSSQSNLAGYASVIQAAYHYPRAFPMLMTSAGTILAAKVLVLGAGVAGLQAIATSKRLGAVVSSYDVRLIAKEQVESLGAKFINTIEQNIEHNFENKGGYAARVDQEYQELQNQLLDKHISTSDIVITTAQIPGKQAPMLISKDMIAKMQRGSVIIDIAAGSGGNTQVTKADEIFQQDGVKVIGYSNICSLIPLDSSKLYAKNLYNTVKYILHDGRLNTKDEVVKAMLLTLEGEIHYGL
jgi:NAD(P) transhydrogenase subunit alpha